MSCLIPSAFSLNSRTAAEFIRCGIDFSESSRKVALVLKFVDGNDFLYSKALFVLESIPTLEKALADLDFGPALPPGKFVQFVNNFVLIFRQQNI